MNQWLQSLPKTVLVGGALVVGIIFILILNPPHTVCQSQLVVFKDSQKGFLYLDSKKSYVKTLGYQKSKSSCMEGANKNGACADWFSGLRKVIRDLENASTECSAEFSSESMIDNLTWQSLELIARLAWGSKPPESYLDRYGFLDDYHLGIYCDLKRVSENLYGKDAFDEFRENTMKSLPGANGLDRKEIWNRSVFSHQCLAPR